MKKFALSVILSLSAAILTSPVMAAQECPNGYQHIYQYSVGTTPYSDHVAEQQAVFAAAQTHCDNTYGSQPSYQGAFVNLNSMCTSFRVYCRICRKDNGLFPDKFPMSLYDAAGIGDGVTGGTGVIVDAGQVFLDRDGRFIPGFLVEYAYEGAAGVMVEIDANTGENSVVELEPDRR